MSTIKADNISPVGSTLNLTAPVAGLSVAGGLTVGGTAFFSGGVTFAGSAFFSGGVTFAGSAFFSGGVTFAGSSVRVTNSTASSSTSTGALVVSGGVGVGGDLNVGSTGSFSRLNLTTATHTVNGGNDAPAIHMRAFVCFNSTNGSIYASQNVSNIEAIAGGQASGDWYIYFDKKPPAANAYVVSAIHNHHTGGGVSCSTVYEASVDRVLVQFWVNGAPANPTWACVAMYW